MDGAGEEEEDEEDSDRDEDEEVNIPPIRRPASSSSSTSSSSSSSPETSSERSRHCDDVNANDDVDDFFGDLLRRHGTNDRSPKQSGEYSLRCFFFFFKFK